MNILVTIAPNNKATMLITMIDILPTPGIYMVAVSFTGFLWVEIFSRWEYVWGDRFRIIQRSFAIWDWSSSLLPCITSSWETISSCSVSCFGFSDLQKREYRSCVKYSCFRFVYTGIGAIFSGTLPADLEGSNGALRSSMSQTITDCFSESHLPSIDYLSASFDDSRTLEQNGSFIGSRGAFRSSAS